MTKTIGELYKEKQKQIEEEKRLAINKKQIALAEHIEHDLFKNEALIDVVTMELLERGNVIVTGFGCLCQDGYCSWQKGFINYLLKYHDEWNDQDVSITYGIKGVRFSVQGKDVERQLPSVLDKNDYIID